MMLLSNMTYPDNEKQQTRVFRTPCCIRDWPNRIGAVRILHQYLPKVTSDPTQYVERKKTRILGRNEWLLEQFSNN